jgi:hypothetical protein
MPVCGRAVQCGGTVSGPRVDVSALARSILNTRACQLHKRREAPVAGRPAKLRTTVDGASRPVAVARRRWRRDGLTTQSLVKPFSVMVPGRTLARHCVCCRFVGVIPDALAP